MSSSVNPALYYREAVRTICAQYRQRPGADPERDFQEYLERHFLKEKTRLQDLQSRGVPPSELIVVRNGLFVLAAGLLTFGRLDVAGDVLDNIPSSGGVRRLALSLKAMLPLPEGLDPIGDPDRVKVWLHTQRSRLVWNESEGRYEVSPVEDHDRCIH